MKVVITTDGVFAASRLKDKIIKTINGEIGEMHIDTWSYVRSGNNFDVIYHNPSQYVNNPDRNVVFQITLNGDNLIFTCTYWLRNPEPTKSMYCIHVGRLTEMLLNYFSDSISKYVVIDF